MSEQKKNHPIETLRDGNLKAAVFENARENGTQHNVSFARLYQDREGQTREAQSFSGSDLLRLSKLAERSYEAIRERRSQARQETRARDRDRE
ncbi:MAG: hypothetical protein AAF718_03560 [Pseudomonadota bacterium]